MARKSKKPFKRGINDIHKWQITQLAKNGGFSARAIAARINQTTLGRVTDSQVHQVRTFLQHSNIKLMAWRNLISPLAAEHAATVTRFKAKKTRRLA